MGSHLAGQKHFIRWHTFTIDPDGLDLCFARADNKQTASNDDDDGRTGMKRSRDSQVSHHLNAKKRAALPK